MDAEFPIDLLDDPVELARFDGWSEHFSYDAWMSAAATIASSR